MLAEHWHEIGFFYVVGWILAIWAIIHIVQSTTAPLGKALWIAAVLFLPVFGFILWFFLGPRSAKK